MERPLRFYIVCALSKASVKLKNKLATLRQYLKTHHPEWEVLEFYGLGHAPSDGAIVTFDLEQVEKSDMLIVLCDEDTWGGGIEIGVGLMTGKPMLFLATSEWVKTRMITGPCDLWPEQCMIRGCASPYGAAFHFQAAIYVKEAISQFELAILDEESRMHREMQAALQRLPARLRPFLRQPTAI